MRVRWHTLRALGVVELGALVGLAALASCREPAPMPSTTPERPVARAEPKSPSDGQVDLDLDLHGARELLRRLDGGAAFAAYARLLRVDPHDALAGLELAQTAVEFGWEARAEPLLAEIVASERTQGLGARLGLARLAYARYEQVGQDADFQACERQLRNVLAVDPKHPQALAQAVLLYLVRAERRSDNHAPLALAICEAQEPSHATLAASCAEEARRRGDPRRARELFARATQADADHHGAWLRWGMLELEVGNLRSARDYLEQATRSPWPSVRIAAHSAHGVALDRLGDTPGAIAAYRSARELCDRTNHPAPPDLLFNLGLAASRAANAEAEIAEARAILEQVLTSGSPSASRRLQVQRALAELESIRAERERAQR